MNGCGHSHLCPCPHQSSSLHAPSVSLPRWCISLSLPPRSFIHSFIHLPPSASLRPSSSGHSFITSTPFSSGPTAAADVVRRMPIMRQIFGVFGVIRPDAQSIRQTLQDDKHVILYPGGVAELFLNDRKKEELYFQKRKGCVRVAMVRCDGRQLRICLPACPRTYIYVIDNVYIISEGARVVTSDRMD
eukprot:GHVU01070453.1.p1 GENE.GHVU01070453.1~~GHVU01070453.1.p1  ORF type:complete len:188 (-),score=24.45 GHVU01070453.1:147-710(-)